MRRGERFASHENLSEPREALGRLVDERVEERGRDPSRGHALAADRLFQEHRRRHGVLDHDAASTVEQWSPDLEGGGVERGRRHLEPRLVRAHAHEVLPEDESDDRAVRDFDALRSARRAGREHHVGRILGADVRSRGRERSLRKPRVGVQPGDALVGGAQARSEDARANPEALEHAPQPLGRIRRIERDVRGAALQDAERADDEADASSDEQRDSISCTDTGCAQRRSSPATRAVDSPRSRTTSWKSSVSERSLG